MSEKVSASAAPEPAPVLAGVGFTVPQVIAPGCLRRLVTVQPGMCGPIQSLAGRVGDWTWEAVSAACGIEVAGARDACGVPSYLAYCYFRIASAGDFDPRRLTFGDRLEVVSQVYRAGPLLVLTVHRIRRAEDEDEEPGEAVPFGPAELHRAPRADCFYVETLNVWLSRSTAGSNAALVQSAPAGFTSAHLPEIEPAYSPRALCADVRGRHSFPDQDSEPWQPVPPGLDLDHPVDLTRDVNGAGLVYFASFFSIAESAQLMHWRDQGRDNQAFLDRVVEDARICYLGNADLDSTLRLRLRLSRHRQDQALEKTAITIKDLATDRVIAVGEFRHRTGSSRPTTQKPGRGERG
ncbi:LnmK family bifunctional acyltransferase/decarboxylase [Streptomyces sp. NBC_00690]|uniref:LnmK family bifunctional acyltransferase/decarboxylase n=1 Tax=Streptomyces sp. NBC_00690 TaxID=2975808 RepID=UPI002E2C8110|nr:LnmK family bifunctional acyltransferase/decarboxylase [Streptomyces sp. NBC_00690]